MMRNVLVVLLLLAVHLSSAARQSLNPATRQSRNIAQSLRDICRSSAYLYFNLMAARPQLYRGWTSDLPPRPEGVDNRTATNHLINHYFWPKPVATPPNSICNPMNTTCCRTNAEKHMVRIAQREYGEFFLNITQESLRGCFVIGRYFYRAMHSTLVEIERQLELYANEELDNKLPINFFQDFFQYLNNFLFDSDLCALPAHLRIITMKIFNFVYDAQQGQDLRSTQRNCYLNVSGQIIDPLYNQLFNGLQRQLYNLDLIFRAMKTSENLVKKIRRFRFSPECIKPFTQLQYCTQCTGYYDFKPCLHYCLNVFRGCFADIADLHYDYKLLLKAFSDIPSDILPTFQPGAFIHNSLRYFVDLARDLRSRDLKTEVQESCSGAMTVKKRSSTRYPRIATFAHTTPTSAQDLEYSQVYEAFSSEQQCMENLGALLNTFPEEMCYLPSKFKTIADTGNQMCWTGHSLGTYTKPLVPSSKEAQINNPVFENATHLFSSQFDSLKLDISLIQAEINTTLEDMLCLYDEECMATPFYLCEVEPEDEEDDDNTTIINGSGEIDGEIDDSLVDDEEGDVLDPEAEIPHSDDSESNTSTTVNTSPPWSNSEPNTPITFETSPPENENDESGTKNTGVEEKPTDTTDDKDDKTDPNRDGEDPVITFTGGTILQRSCSMETMLLFVSLACLLC